MTDLNHLIQDPVFKKVGDCAHAMGRECYVVGGYVRDAILRRHNKDYDFVTVGSGIELAEAVHRALGRRSHLAVYRNYGTAQVKLRDVELEFVGARRESYSRDSRNPIVEDGTLEDDIARRDFTINAMAISLNPETYGQLIDLYGGVDDICDRIIRTPLDPDITFSDDPLRMMRAIRFATQLAFDIYPDTLDSIARNAERITIITTERITTQLQKIMASPKPSVGRDLLLRTGLLKIIFPELAAMKGVETINGRGHKDNFYHTLQVLDNVAAKSDNIWLRWAALLHDIAKPQTKKWDPQIGWTFHNHNFIGSKMIPAIFRKLKLPLGQEMKYVQKLVELHMRPIALVEDEVTDSAVRRLINYAEDDLADLMILARADITSKNIAKKQRFLDNFDIVDRKFLDIMAKDADAKFRPALDGHDIMQIFDLPQSREVGCFMQAMTRAAKDCEIENTADGCLRFVLDMARDKGIEPSGLDAWQRARAAAEEAATDGDQAENK